jgi:hypothetical protein
LSGAVISTVGAISIAKGCDAAPCFDGRPSACLANEFAPHKGFIAPANLCSTIERFADYRIEPSVVYS